MCSACPPWVTACQWCCPKRGRALPLVATDVGALPEIVQDGRTGLIVEPGNVASLVAALSRLVTDANLRRTYGDNAAALVADRFDAAKNSARIVDLLLDIMGPSAARRPADPIDVAGGRGQSLSKSAHQPCWYAGHHRVSFDISIDDGAGRNNGASADRDTG